MSIQITPSSPAAVRMSRGPSWKPTFRPSSPAAVRSMTRAKYNDGHTISAVEIGQIGDGESWWGPWLTTGAIVGGLALVIWWATPPANQYSHRFR